VIVAAAIAITALAAVTDLRSGRIPNAITYPAIVLGLALGFAPGAELSWETRVAGLLIAGLPCLALFWVRTLGGGDVKLLAAVGAVVGFPLVADILVWTLIAGAALGLAMLVRDSRLIDTLRHIAVAGGVVASGRLPGYVPAQDVKLPLGLAIFVATALVLLVPASRFLGPAS